MKESLQRFVLFLRNTDAKTRFDAFLLIIILIGLVATIVVVKQRQDLRSRASQENNIEVVDENGNLINTKDENGNTVVESQKIRIKINPPTNWGQSQGFVPNLINSAYGQEEDQGSPQCLDKGTLRGGTCINANYYKRDGTFVRDGNEPDCYQCAQNDISPQSTQPLPTQLPTPTQTQESEQVQWIRISLNKQNIESGNCTNTLLPEKQGLGSSDQRQHCMEFGLTDPYFLQNGGIVDWWLPPEPETYVIYVGFVSSKGNYQTGPQITVAYKPKSGTISGKITVKANNRPYQRVTVALYGTDKLAVGTLAQKDLIALNDTYIYDDADYNYTFTDLERPKYTIMAYVSTAPIEGAGSEVSSSDFDERVNINSIKNLAVELPPLYAPGTPETKDIALLGDLTLQGIGNDRDLNNTPRIQRKFFIVLIYDYNNELVSEKGWLIPYNKNNGKFYITGEKINIGHPLGKTVIKIGLEGYLTQTIYNGNIENETRSIHTGTHTLLAGDINRDNIIDHTDFDLVARCYEQRSGIMIPGGTCAQADLDDDGEVNMIDLNMVLANLGKKGD